VACEFSGVVRDAFAARGHEAWSCDLVPSESPGNHIVGDARDAIQQDWDLVIAHPPCTYFVTSGAQWFYHPDDRALPRADRRPHPDFPDRAAQRDEMIGLFMSFANCAPRVAIENPIGIMSSRYRLPDQIIQPFWFGHDASKATCLWLKHLPPLRPTKIVELTYHITEKGRRFQRWFWDTSSAQHGAKRSAARSRTFRGIAEAMADQWSEEALGNFIEYKQASIFDFLCRYGDATREDAPEGV
jgi:hypothetical protein